MADAVYFEAHEGRQEPANKTTVQDLFDCAYELGQGLKREYRLGAQPLIDGVADRVNKDPAGAALEGLGAVAACGFLIAAAPAEGALAGALGAAAVLTTCGVVTYEAFKQMDRIARQISGEEKQVFQPEKIYGRRSSNKLF
ncbi:MAG TPA: hypothetical protein PKD05_24100 [Candidatus Melainabacteria bacterium]|nr:hypothetical protein [Candidatus Melainabacteria bacterium]HMP54653.1 hypothetical protein [Candidatus Melainabacteria bacterium]